MQNQYKTERDFPRWLNNHLNKSIVKRGKRKSYIGERFVLNTKHDSKWQHERDTRPDIEITHQIKFDLSYPQREQYVIPPTNPAYIECKMGDAYRSVNKRVINRIDTGIPDIQREFSNQLPRYQYHTDQFEINESPISTVFVTCPYMLAGEFHKKEIAGFSVEQFEQTLRSLNLG